MRIMLTSEMLERIFIKVSIIGCLMSIICLMTPNKALSQGSFNEKFKGMGHAFNNPSNNPSQVHELGDVTVIPVKNTRSENNVIGDKWAIIIGSSKFKDPNIPAYNSGAKNASDFAAFLTSKCNFAADHVQLLVDESATKINWLNLVGDSFLPRCARKNDLVVLYFSGYVSSPQEDIGGSTFLCAYDTKRDALYQTGLETQARALSRMVQSRVRGVKTVIIFDTKPLPSPDSDKTSKSTDPHEIDNIKSGDVVYISGSLTGSESRDARKGGDSEFLQAFIQSLIKAGPDGTLDKIFASTKESLQTAVKRDYGAGADQTPQIGGDANLIKSIILMAPPSERRELPFAARSVLKSK